MSFDEFAQKAFKEYDTKILPNKMDEISRGYESISKKTITLWTECFEAEFNVRILPKHKKLVLQIQNLAESGRELANEEEAVKVTAELIAELCVTPGMDKQFWLDYEEKTGNLAELTVFILEEIQKVEKDACKFRRIR